MKMPRCTARSGRLGQWAESRFSVEGNRAKSGLTRIGA